MSVRRSLIVAISLLTLLIAPGSALAGSSVDFTPPVVTITTPPDGATYLLNQAVAAAFSCTDEGGGSGLKSCVGEVANGENIDTTTLGQKLFTVTAKDNADNMSSVTHMYTVVADAKPDVRIRRIGRTNLVGNDIYSPSAAGEELGASLKAPGIRRFVITIQNDGTTPDSYTVSSNGNLVLGYDISYHHGHPGTDISTPMNLGIYQTPTIQPGGFFRIRAYVSIGSGPTQPGVTRLITARSNNDISVSDAVRFTIGEPLPDCTPVRESVC